MSRLLKNKSNRITQAYKKGNHDGIDIVGAGATTDYIIAHSEGEVVGFRKNYNKTDKTGGSYGNYVKIKHNNGYYTVYAHMKYNTVTVKTGDKVKKGDILGYMGNTGHSFGSHLHFEVRNTSDTKIDPTPYLEADLPEKKKKYTKGRYEALEKVAIRTGAGTSYPIKKVKDLTADGKKHATSKSPNANARYKVGTIFDVLEVIEKSDKEVWGKGYSGYINIICNNYPNSKQIK